MDFWVTEDIRDSWVFQDAERFLWWADLHFMADERGEIHKSLSDLSRRWKADKTKVSRFLKKMESATLLQHQVQRIILCDTRIYKGECNTKCNTFATFQEKSPFPPAPPLSPKEIINNNCDKNAHTRERKSWKEEKEICFREQFIAEGRIMASARKLGCDALGISSWLEKFMDHCQSSDLGHESIGHFGSHFNKFVETEKAKPLLSGRSSQSTLDWNTQIAQDLGLIN